MPEPTSYPHTNVADPTATMHIHTTHDGHQYLVEGPPELCPAWPGPEQSDGKVADRPRSGSGTSSVMVLVVVVAALAVYAVVRRARR